MIWGANKINHSSRTTTLVWRRIYWKEIFTGYNKILLAFTRTRTKEKRRAKCENQPSGNKVMNVKEPQGPGGPNATGRGGRSQEPGALRTDRTHRGPQAPHNNSERKLDSCYFKVRAKRSGNVLSDPASPDRQHINSSGFLSSLFLRGAIHWSPTKCSYFMLNPSIRHSTGSKVLTAKYIHDEESFKSH